MTYYHPKETTKKLELTNIFNFNFFLLIVHNLTFFIDSKVYEVANSEKVKIKGLTEVKVFNSAQVIFINLINWVISLN